MECFDVSLALNSLVGASLVVAGSKLMMHPGRVARGYGAYCFALGFLILGLAAAGQGVGEFDLRSRRYLIGVGSAAAVVAGTFMMYYHVQENVHRALMGHADPAHLGEAVVKSIPVIDHVLIYGGYAGLVVAAGMSDYGDFNFVKAGLVLAALVVIGYTKGKMLEAVASGQDAEKHQVGHLLSWGLLVLALGYNC